MEQDHSTAPTRRPRPCDACRRRKRKCVTESGATVCQLCRSNGLSQCLYNDADGPAETLSKKRKATDELAHAGATESRLRVGDVIEDYDSLREFSLLKQNLGLQQHRYLRHVGPSDELDVRLFNYCSFDDRDEYRMPNGTSLRKVSANEQFILTPYSHTRERDSEFEQLDAVEQLVAPNGKHLVRLYFEYVHPNLPIIDQKTFLEKYERTHREFSPPCLAGVYLTACNWWHYDKFLSSQTKPDTLALENLAKTALTGVITRPKLSVLQGGLLLLHNLPTGEAIWATSSQMVAVAQELGVHLDCSTWRIPNWEKSLRTRLAWSIFCLDKWMALSRGRPSHIFDEEWALIGLSSDDAKGKEGASAIEVLSNTSFQQLTSLTTILSRITKLFYSTSARLPRPTDPRPLLEAAKPVQIELKSWYKTLNEYNDRQDREVTSTKILPSLHLAYYATEITLHRAIQKTLTNHPGEAVIYKYCRDAARERALKAVQIVKDLRIADLYGFWYSFSGQSFVSIGTFMALLLVTSRSLDEATEFKRLLDDYRWTLRTMSGCLSHIQYAVACLDASLWHLENISLEDIINRSAAPSEEPRPVPGNGEVHVGANTERVDVNPTAEETSIRRASKIFDASCTDLPASASIATNGGGVGSSQALPNEDLTWVDMPFASSDFMGDANYYSSQDLAEWQFQGIDFYGRDWQPPSETSEYWALNRSLEDL